MPSETWPAAIAAALLRRGAMVHAASCVVTLAAIAGASVALAAARPGSVWLPIACVGIAAGVIEFWLAARVAIDADLFQAIAARPGDLEGFDRAMLDLGLLSAAKTGRSLTGRTRAALRLLMLQASVLGLQVATLLVAGWIGRMA
jgi:hypothetical protein